MFSRLSVSIKSRKAFTLVIGLFIVAFVIVPTVQSSVANDSVKLRQSADTTSKQAEASTVSTGSDVEKAASKSDSVGTSPAAPASAKSTATGPNTANTIAVPIAGRLSQQEVEAHKSNERATLGALRSITVKEGNGSIVRFVTIGASQTGYLVRWSNTVKTGQSAADGTAAVTGIERTVGAGQEGSATISNLKFAFGEYKVTICQNLGGSCGVESNPIYLTVSPEYNECPSFSGLCTVTGSIQTYRL